MTCVKQMRILPHSFFSPFCEWNSALKHTIGGQNMSSRNSQPSRGKLSPQAKNKGSLSHLDSIYANSHSQIASEVQTNASLSISRDDAG